MADLNAAFNDVKMFSDSDLQRELQSPSGLIPDYIVMSELQDRQSLRSSSGAKPQMSMKDELLSKLPPVQPQGYSRGGLISGINPFSTMAQVLRNPEQMGGLLQESMNNNSGGLPSLQAAQAPGAPGAPPGLDTMVPTPSGAAPTPQHYAMGGLATLRR